MVCTVLALRGVWMLAATKGAGLNVNTVATVVLAAVAFATLAGTVWHNQQKGSRDKWRGEDSLWGYRRPDGSWAPGVIDKVNGWSDGEVDHEGLADQVNRHEREITEHRRNPRAHAAQRER